MKRTAVRELLKLTAQPDMISFAGGLPAPEFFPLPQVKRATEAVLARVGAAALQYGETEGIVELRDWIAERFSKPGVQVTRANVVIVTGAQQGLDLIGRIFLDDGDKVIVENPTYLALLSAWRPLGVQFLPVLSDADGMRVDGLEPLLRQRPKLIYSIPNFQNPQGTTLSLERRARLANFLRDHDVALVEDDPYGDLRFDGDALPHLFELGTGSIYVGTFSKVLMPGLRVGWVMAPESVIEKLVQAKQAVDLHTSTFNQHLTYELVRGGLLEEQIPRLRQAYRERRDAMLAALEKCFPIEAIWTRPKGGMFLMVTLPENIDASELLLEAIRQNVAFVPGDDFHVDGGGRNTLRLNFSNAKPGKISEGIGRLASVLKRMLAQSHRG